MSTTYPKVKSEVSELSLLFEISQILDRSIDLRDELGPVLKVIAKHTGMVRGTITLVNRTSGELYIEAAHGLSGDELERGKYQQGEGVVGQVVQSGQPVVIPRVSEEPLFLNRTQARDMSREDVSYICVPIKMETAVIGALSVDTLFADQDSLEEDLRLVSIIASMIAQAVRLRQEHQEERERLIEENTRLQVQLQEKFHPANMIGRSSAMQDVFDLIQQVAKSDATVLIRGESGVGKDVVAQAIHSNGLRAQRPYVRVNCAAYPKSVIESELFGHEKDTFIAPTQQRHGRFDLAADGTIFLDDIDKLSLHAQVRLSHALQDGAFERVGGAEAVAVDVRIIAATKRDLEGLMAKEKFRQDLYYRLNVFPIHIPPLRERRTDILELANFFVEKYSKANHKYVRRISTPAIDMLMSYHWPGNVRELENCVERAVLLTTDDVVHGTISHRRSKPPKPRTRISAARSKRPSTASNAKCSSKRSRMARATRPRPHVSSASPNA